MMLKRKINMVLAAFFLLYGGLFYGVWRFMISPGIFTLQDYMAGKDLDRCVEALGREIHYLDTLCWDWASWDDTYAFVRTPSTAYIRTNLPASAFTDNKLSLVIICDETGKVVWKQQRDPEQGKVMPDTAFPSALTAPGSPLLLPAHNSAGPPPAPVNGYYNSPTGPLIVAARPILTSDNQGPARGTLIVGRPMTDRLIRTLSAQIQVDFELIPVSAVKHRMPLSMAKLLESPQSRRIIDDTSNPDRIQAHTLLPDVFGRNALIVSANIAPAIRQIADANFMTALSTLAIAGLLVIVLTGAVLQVTVIRPLTRLTRTANTIRQSEDLTGRLKIKRTDEIGMLAQAFNQILDMLADQSHQMLAINQRLQRDLISRKTAEDELRKSKDYFRTLLNSLEGDLLVLDESEKITDANKNFLQTLGRSRSEIINCSFSTLLDRYQTPEGRSEDPFGFHKVLLSGVPQNYRLTQRLGHRTEQWLDVSLSRITAKNGTPARVIMTLRDVTREVFMGRHLIQLQKIEAIGIMAAGIAHEFNNILMSILLNLEIGIQQTRDGVLRESLEVSHQATLRAAALVKQLLLFSRKNKRAQHPLATTPLVKEVLKLIDASLKENVNLSIDLGAEPDQVMATPDQIQQLLVNLCQNACHAMRKTGGVLTVTTATVILEAEDPEANPGLKPGLYWLLEVGDTGEGMDAEVIARIFDPFFSMKKTGDGTGLGLSAVHGIVQDLGGTIRAESSPGQGSVFRIWLPATGREAGREPSPPKVLPDNGFGRVLVVDDEEILATAIQNALEHFGYETTICLEGESALERFSADPTGFDVVITDLTMPELSGIELAERLQGLRPDLPVILCTGYYDTLGDGNALPENIRSVINKPLNLYDLEAIVRRYIAKTAE